MIFSKSKIICSLFPNARWKVVEVDFFTDELQTKNKKTGIF